MSAYNDGIFSYFKKAGVVIRFLRLSKTIAFFPAAKCFAPKDSATSFRVRLFNTY
jgi:hypothetical protein